MIGRWKRSYWLLWGLLCLAPVWGLAQQEQQKPDIPDAPSATRPPQPFPPSTAPAPVPQPSPEAAPADKPVPENQPPPAGRAEPTPNIKTVPQGGTTPAGGNSREEMYTLRVNVNFVPVPVTVKDKVTGRLVNGLLPKDFSIYEDGVKQKLSYFTSDPFFISAAVILDLGLPDVAVQKIHKTYPALAGAFSPYDEVSIYTYSSSVARLTDFRTADQKLVAALDDLRIDRGRNNGVPVLSGPLASGPMVNNMPVGGGPPPVVTPPKESHVLNDAILRAALDLAKQDRTRRKIIFIISDGRELGSTASYADTLKVLLSHEITVYAVATDSSALPGYKQLSKLHLPRLGYDNLLPKYVAATGGEVFTELSQQAIETAYAGAMGEARNQYTLGYQTKVLAVGRYRDIEVKVGKPGLDVHAKTGYYTLPMGR